MMIGKMAVSALSMGLLLGAAGTAPADQEKKEHNKKEASLQLPITGSFDGGTFAGTLSIEKFAATPDGKKVVAIGFVRGTATSSAGAPLGTVVAGPISLPVSRPEPGDPIVTTTAVGAAVVAQATCQVVHIELGAVNLNVLGLTVTTQPIVLDLSGDTAGPLGNLVCTLLETVNTVVGLVDLLNQILGLLTGLLGGILPG
jgi:hypothetical protein